MRCWWAIRIATSSGSTGSPRRHPGLEEAETLAKIEQRLYRWHCGCSHQKILAAIAPAFRADPEGIFGAGESIRVQCPRCAAAYHLTREAMEAYLAHTHKGGA